MMMRGERESKRERERKMMMIIPPCRKFTSMLFKSHQKHDDDDDDDESPCKIRFSGTWANTQLLWLYSLLHVANLYGLIRSRSKATRLKVDERKMGKKSMKKPHIFLWLTITTVLSSSHFLPSRVSYIVTQLCSSSSIDIYVCEKGVYAGGNFLELCRPNFTMLIIKFRCQPNGSSSNTPKRNKLTHARTHTHTHSTFPNTEHKSSETSIHKT